MNVLTKIKQLIVPNRTYKIQKAESNDLLITHRSGVAIQIKEDGTVIVASPSNLELHANGNLQITSGSHIGLVAPRIDLN